jgi:molybdenum cofactor cytidylyltransferase
VSAGTETAGYGGVVLAAGSSRRLGEPKQLLVFRGEPLVRRAARAAVEAGLWPVVVVVALGTDAVRGALAGLPIATVSNHSPDAGLGGSIQLGIRRLAECAPEARGVALLACDQPFVGASHLEALAAAARGSARPIAASAYAGGVGVPALFAASLFGELRALQGDAGVRAVLERDALRVAPVPLPRGEVDVDTREDWERLLAEEGLGGTSGPR